MLRLRGNGLVTAELMQLRRGPSVSSTPMSRRAKLIALAFLLAAVIVLSLVLARSLGMDSPLVLLMVFTVFVVALIAVYVRMIVAARRLALLNQHGVALLNQGRAEESLREFESCVAQAKAARLESYGRVFQSNVATALVELGRAEQAHALLRALLAESDLRRSLTASWGSFVGLVSTVLWLSHEAAPEEAGHFLDEYESDVPPPQRASLISPRVLVLLRQERYSDVDALLEGRWLEAEGVLPARRLRRLVLLWAFALHHAGRADESRRKLEAAGPDIAEEARALTERWPDLEAFLASTQGYREVAR